MAKVGCPEFFICPNCESETKLIKLGALGVVCDKCCPSIRRSIGGVKTYVGNRHYPKMTTAMRQNITTRKVREDGRNRPDSRYRDSTEGR